MSADFQEIANDLEERMGSGGAEPWDEDVFRDHALRVFACQYEFCAPYRALCDARGVRPDSIDGWQDVPPVPATAFKHFDFVATGPGSDPVREATVFRTSGTTRGAARRGRHHVPRLSLYRASLLPPFQRALVPEGGPIRFVSLVPSPAQAPDSSLSYMVGAAAEALATGTNWLVDAQGRWAPEVDEVMASIAHEGAPVLLLGTALSFVHALERAGRGEPSLAGLPEGSRVMETGGFKGARRAVSRAELYRGIAGLTGVEPGRIVDEYGMTELLSQLWEPVLTEGPGAAGTHVPAPWLRVRALDPVTLEELPEGAEGVLAFFDLANAGSVSHVLTEDLGSVVGGRVRLRGRAAGSEPRGCSRAMDELMSAAAR